jgi:protein phosphatase
MAYSTVLRGSGATHVGRVRSKNDDRYLTHAELWVVADGMGGHRGGDVAARLACESLAQGLPAPSVEGLVDAIDAANQAVHNAGSSDPDLTGMGTTVVALALVNDSGEEVLAVASVGDSRVYRLTGGELEQLTEDHSLVADMVREGSLSPEEAATHPQRNILTRVLGVYDEIPVDVVTIIPHHGDRYLLCSDGLFNEVSEDGIGAVLRRLAEPADAADELVRLAVEAGGRDNVTVVVVDVVSDGNAAITASVALAGDNLAADADTTYSPGGAYADTTPDTDDIDAIRFRRLRSRNEDDADGGGGRHRGDRPRRLTWRVVLFTVLVLGVVGGALASVQWYGRSAYYVGFEGDRVAIFRGRPGGVWWVDPTLVDTTRLDRNEVPADTVDALVSGKEVASLEEATQYVDRLEERVFRAKEEANQTTTTTLPTTTVPTTTLPVP